MTSYNVHLFLGGVYVLSQSITASSREEAERRIRDRWMRGMEFEAEEVRE